MNCTDEIFMDQFSLRPIFWMLIYNIIHYKVKPIVLLVLACIPQFVSSLLVDSSFRGNEESLVVCQGPGKLFV